MKAVVGGICAVLLGAAAYFFLAGPSSEDKVVSLLEASFGDTADVRLNGCDLRVLHSSTSNVGTLNVAMRADLRLYEVQTVRIIPNRETFIYYANRERATNAMFDQVDAVFAVADPSIRSMVPERDALRDILNDPGGNVFSSLMAQVETNDQGEAELIAHEKAPLVHEFAQQVLALPAPASYSVTTTYRGDAQDDLLTAEIVAVPPLRLTFHDEPAAQAFGQAMYEHAAFVCP